MQEEYAERSDDDYEAFLPQASKFFQAYGFLAKIAAESGGRIDPVRFSRKTEVGSITAYFTLFDITGDEIQEFCRVFAGASALTIEPLTDGTICISSTFPGVFQKKEP